MNQDTVGDLRALQLENARLQRELAKKEVRGCLGCCSCAGGSCLGCSCAGGSCTVCSMRAWKEVGAGGMHLWHCPRACGQQGRLSN